MLQRGGALQMALYTRWGRLKFLRDTPAVCPLTPGVSHDHPTTPINGVQIHTCYVRGSRVGMTR